MHTNIMWCLLATGDQQLKPGLQFTMGRYSTAVVDVGKISLETPLIFQEA